MSTMTVIVPGYGTWSNHPAMVMYSNGFEAAIPASAGLLQALRSGNVVRIRAIPDSPIFEFSLFGVGPALDKAIRGSSVCH